MSGDINSSFIAFFSETHFVILSKLLDVNQSRIVCRFTLNDKAFPQLHVFVKIIFRILVLDVG